MILFGVQSRFNNEKGEERGRKQEEERLKGNKREGKLHC